MAMMAVLVMMAMLMPETGIGESMAMIVTAVCTSGSRTTAAMETPSTPFEGGGKPGGIFEGESISCTKILWWYQLLGDYERYNLMS